MNNMTYAGAIDLIDLASGNLYVAVHYPSGTYEWLPVDKVEYLRQLRMISNAAEVPYPCFIERERDGEVFIHPKIANKLKA